MEEGKYNWNHGLTKRLIEYFELNSVLYDSTDKDYKHPVLRKQLLMKLAMELGCTVKDVNVKWNHLKTYFGRENKKVKASKTSGTSPDCVYNPRWEFFKDLDFLKTSVKTRQSQSSANPLEIGASTSKTFDDVYEEPTHPSGSNNPSDDGRAEEVQFDTSDIKNEKKNGKRKRSAKTVSDEALEEAVKWLKAPTCSAKDDEEFHFAMMVASKLRAIEPYVRDQLKLQILQLLILILILNF